MFFFIGGLTPKIKKLDDQPKICPRCGQASFYKVRIDSYLNLFFIPICPVKRGQPFYLCENCRLKSPESRESFSGQEQGFSSSRPSFCPQCGQPVSPDFRFCPYCGQALN